MAKVIGIDLGTTNSCVAIMDGSQPRVIENAEGARTTPSIVGYTESERLVGQPAKRQAVTNPENTVFGVKRLIGRRANDEDLAKDKKNLPYAVVNGGNGDAWVEVRGEKYSPAQVSALILQKMKETAESYLGEEVTQAVITVPAYFNDAQRQATKDAGKIAGLEVLRIINEPTAAALAYGLDKKEAKTIAVYDLGGGTFDVTILEIDDGLFEVKSTNGDTFLGGEDFDMRIVQYLADEFKKEHGVDLTGDKMALQRLKEAAEKAKIELSSSSQTEINQPFISMGSNGQPLHMVMKLTRAKLESLVGDLIKKSIDPCKAALKDAGLSSSDIDEVVLVGGSCRIPAVQNAVEEWSGRQPRMSDLDTDVARGAALYGARRQSITDVVSHTFGVELLDANGAAYLDAVVEKNTPLPTSAVRAYPAPEHAELRIYQGEAQRPDEALLRGRLPLKNPAGRVRVTFSVGSDGTLAVHAQWTGVSGEITRAVPIENRYFDFDDRAEALRAWVQRIHLNL